MKTMTNNFSTTHFYKDTKLLRYLQCPTFLWDTTPYASLSNTAKLLYIHLLDRSFLSQKNGWEEQGHIFVLFPIASLSKLLGCSQTTTKSALDELRHCDLLQTKQQGRGKPNKLFIKAPIQSLDQSHKTANFHPTRQTDSGSLVSQILTPNKTYKSKTNQIRERGVFTYDDSFKKGDSL